MQSNFFWGKKEEHVLFFPWGKLDEKILLFSFIVFPGYGALPFRLSQCNVSKKV